MICIDSFFRITPVHGPEPVYRVFFVIFLLVFQTESTYT